MKKRMFVAACIVMVATLSVFAAGPGEDVKAPEEFKVKFETSAGDFIVEVHREDAPNGVDRFYDAVKQGFYNECRFFRVVAVPVHGTSARTRSKPGGGRRPK